MDKSSNFRDLIVDKTQNSPIDPLSVNERIRNLIHDVSSKSTFGKSTNCLGQIRESDVFDLKSLLPYLMWLLTMRWLKYWILTTEVEQFLSGNSGLKIVILGRCLDIFMLVGWRLLYCQIVTILITMQMLQSFMAYTQKIDRVWTRWWTSSCWAFKCP